MKCNVFVNNNKQLQKLHTALGGITVKNEEAWLQHSVHFYSTQVVRVCRCRLLVLTVDNAPSSVSSLLLCRCRCPRHCSQLCLCSRFCLYLCPCPSLFFAAVVSASSFAYVSAHSASVTPSAIASVTASACRSLPLLLLSVCQAVRQAVRQSLSHSSESQSVRVYVPLFTIAHFYTYFFQNQQHDFHSQRCVAASIPAATCA